MRDDTSTGPGAADEGALLAAYLDGDTDELTTARIERRLASDDAFAARLDALAAMRARLQRLDEIVVPPAVRTRLHERLDAERAASGDTDRRHVPGRAAPLGTEDPGMTTEVRRARRWPALAAPAPALAAAAAIVVVAVLGAAAVLGQLGTGGTAGSAEGGVSLQDQDGAAEGAPQAAAPAEEAAGDAAGGGATTAERAASEAARGGGTRGDQQAAAKVEGDADIAARAERLRDDPPSDLRARERRLRERAGLPTARLCVREVRATTVDLIDEDGRVALAVMVRGPSPQIVLLDPRTCAAIRTIPSQR